MLAYKLTCKHTIPEHYYSQFNAIVRYAYKRMLENPDAKQQDIEKQCKQMNNITLDASFIKMAVNKAKSLPKRKIQFARKLFNKLKYKKIEKGEYLRAKNASLFLRGSSCDNNGNRKAKLDLANNQIIFKPSKKEHYVIDLGKDKRIEQLKQIQILSEEGKACFSLEIRRDAISVIFDEKLLSKQNYKPRAGRILAIDMNPNYIGLIIKNKEHIFHKEIIDLRELNKTVNKDKKLYETAGTAKYITNLAVHYNVEAVAFEQLTIASREYNKGKRYNKLLNNTWNRAKLIEILQKRCNLQQIKTYKIHAAYSSFVGQMMHEEEYDSIAAALEIARRAIDLQQNSTYRLFPEIEIKDLATRWKEMLKIEIDGLTWKQFYVEMKKKFENSYRFLFTSKQFDGFSFRLKSATSGITCHKIACIN